MKKDIRYYVIGFWEGFDLQVFLKNGGLIFNNFNFIFDKKSPDYVFYSSFTRKEDLNKYPSAIRIFFSGENLSPDFIHFDYWIGFDDLKFGKRYFKCPLLLIENDIKICENTTKDLFCDFCYSHDREDSLRKQILALFNSYKPVSNSGKYLNSNYDIIPSQKWKHKFDIQRRCKFSIVIESTDCEGFVTEKLRHAISNGCLPIYFGTSKVFKYLNKNRIIYGYSFKSKADLLKQIIKLDTNNNLYNKMYSKNVYNANFNFFEFKLKLNRFLINIFNSTKILRETNYAPKYFLSSKENLLKKMKCHIYSIFTSNKRRF